MGLNATPPCVKPMLAVRFYYEHLCIEGTQNSCQKFFLWL